MVVPLPFAEMALENSLYESFKWPRHDILGSPFSAQMRRHTHYFLMVLSSC